MTKPDTIQLIVSNSKIRHCLFCMSYRGIDAHPKLSEMTGQLQDQGALLWNIKLGSIEKEAVDNLVSETLVSLPKDVSYVLDAFDIVLFLTIYLSYPPVYASNNDRASEFCCPK